MGMYKDMGSFGDKCKNSLRTKPIDDRFVHMNE